MIVFLFVEKNFKELNRCQFICSCRFFVLFFPLALEMILGIRIYRDEEASSVYCSTGFPLIAGVGTMTTLLSLRSQFYY
jgi:multiple antibiotic resistance protein